MLVIKFNLFLVAQKRKSRGNIVDVNNSYVPAHKPAKSSGIVTSGKGNKIIV